MKNKKAIRLIRVLLRDWLFIASLGNFLVMFMIPWDAWSLKIVLNNCMFSIGIGYPAMKGMAWISVLLERRYPWLEAPIKRLIYQVLSMSLFSALIIFLGFSIWSKIIIKIC